MERKTHSITLPGKSIVLWPMREDDWPVLLRWNSSPAVRHRFETGDRPLTTMNEVQDYYQAVSQNSLCFIMEQLDQPVGACTLQPMEQAWVRKEYPGFDVRQIDLLIGEPQHSNEALMSEVIRLLTQLAFEQEGVDYLFTTVTDDDSLPNRRAFEKHDFRLVAHHPQTPGSEAHTSFDLLAKNPRLGFHAYAIHLFFDPSTENAIRSVWRELAESGVAPYLHQSANRPHLTLAIYRALDLPAARQRLGEIADQQIILSVSFQYHGVFPGPHPTTFLGPLVTAQLLDLQASVCQQLDGLGELPEFNYYHPGSWIPHCGLALDFDGARLFDSLRIAQQLALPLPGEIQEIGLTEMRPVRHLDQWALKNQ